MLLHVVQYAVIDDVDLLFNLDDRPIVEQPVTIPIFSQVKSSASGDILFPDWNFHEKALHWHANSSWRMDATGLSERFEWHTKTAVAVWRGTSHNGNMMAGSWRHKPRSRLVLLSSAHPSVIDAGFTHIQVQLSLTRGAAQR
jgi:hypothetical protein